VKTTFYETSVLEWFMGPRGDKSLSEAPYQHLLDFPFHLLLQKVEVELIGWLLKTLGFDKKVPIVIEKVNSKLLKKHSLP
jgi:hypothetical protein